MKKINKELYALYLRQQLANDSSKWMDAWIEINRFTGKKSMDFTCPEYKEAVKQSKKIKNSPLYKALEED